jgi:hypothetical protein
MITWLNRTCPKIAFRAPLLANREMPPGAPTGRKNLPQKERMKSRTLDQPVLWVLL